MTQSSKATAVAFSVASSLSSFRDPSLTNLSFCCRFFLLQIPIIFFPIYFLLTVISPYSVIGSFSSCRNVDALPLSKFIEELESGSALVEGSRPFLFSSRLEEKISH